MSQCVIGFHKRRSICQMAHVIKSSEDRTNVADRRTEICVEIGGQIACVVTAAIPSDTCNYQRRNLTESFTTKLGTVSEILHVQSARRMMFRAK